MANRIITASVTGESIKLSNKIAGAAGSCNAVSLALTFDGAWDGTTKKVYFFDANGGNAVVRVLTADVLSGGVYTIPIPGEPLAKAGEITLTVKGVELGAGGVTAERVMVSATTAMKVLSAEVPSSDTAPVEPNATQTEQLQAQIDTLTSSIESIPTNVAAAAESASAAAGSATAAEASKTVAAQSATSAAGSATTASTKATAASGSATAAANSATDADASKTAAASSASGAAASESNAAASANIATVKATAAAASEANALIYKNAAETAKTDAINAKDAAITAKTAAETAKADAVTAKNDAVTAKTAAETAKTAAETAQGAAEAAQSGVDASAADAAGSATSAAESATAAAESASAATSKASAAATSATNAANSASSASSSAATATTKANAAAASATSAASSASTATTKAGEAGTYATNAATSAAEAAQSAQQAAQGQVNADWNVTDTTSKAFILHKPTIPSVPTNVSAFTNDAGYLTEHQDISGKLDKTGDGSNVTAAFTAVESRANVATGEKLSVLFGKIAKWFGDLGALAFKSTAAKSDLASDVQTSLGKADTALQSFTETDPTVPSWAKATTKPAYTKAEVGLSNVDNTADVDKPVSTAQQTALNGKANSSHTHTKSQITDFPTRMTPAAHKASHSTGGADALTPANIGAASKYSGTATLTVAGWTGTAAPFTQAATCSGILATDTPTVDCVTGTDAMAGAAIVEAWGLAVGAGINPQTSAGTITFYASKKPAVAVPFRWEGTR